MSVGNAKNNEDKFSPMDELCLPIFMEKYPGKVCCFCNLSERSALGQRELLKYNISLEVSLMEFELNEKVKKNNTENNTYRRPKGSQKKGTSADGFYELDKVGHSEILELNAIQDSGSIYVHRMCALWSLHHNQIEDIVPSKITSACLECLSRKCSFCGQYGATITCKMNCSQVYHLPCAAASGCFLILESLTAFCSNHLSQVPILCDEKNIECQFCSSLGDISKLIMCCGCGDHFHSSCIGLINLPDTRSGWNCTRCSKCQICRQEDLNDARQVKCEQCQKIYHATCLRPTLSSIPKYGWKCNRCRVCTDCGSRTPGAGTSSRWHCHFSICDSCYQQRNKGFSCPICQKAYRAAAYKEMVKCNQCQRFVHAFCDEEADLNSYHKKKESNPDYEYICPNCKIRSNSELQTIGESSFGQFSEILGKDLDMDSIDNIESEIFSNDDQPKLPSNKKRICLNAIRGKGGKFVLQRPGLLTQLTKKRSARPKGRQLIINNNLSIVDRCVNRSMESDISNEKKMVLCSARDKFILSRDICIRCGSLGIGQDAELITCAQCGQSYHPYCVDVKPSKIMIQRGWRCLDCTICEGCGKKNDEARLLLCDECDISYHIYCVDPPLEAVPQGNWKCKSCTVCQKCGKNPIGKYGIEQNIFECSRCSSQNICPLCSKSYVDGEALIQCVPCEQWFHFSCDVENKNKTPESYELNEYQCSQCRLNNISKLKSITSKKEEINSQTIPLNKSESKVAIDKLERNVHVEQSESVESTHWIDGICVSEKGLNMIKMQTMEFKRKRKMRQPGGMLNKDTCLLNSNENIVKNNSSFDEIHNEKPQFENYKDGMVWEGDDMIPPEGFTIFTNEEGNNILRKKRQRNLQKLGIGGFSVRNRGMKRDNEDSCKDQINLAISNFNKKKKIVRKKQKNKIIEAYPPYLQEAFFGKSLLELGKTPAYDSDSSDGLDVCSIGVHFMEVGKSSFENECIETEVVSQGELKKCKVGNTSFSILSKIGEQLLQSPVEICQKNLSSNQLGEDPISPSNDVNQLETSNRSISDQAMLKTIIKNDIVHTTVDNISGNISPSGPKLNKSVDPLDASLINSVQNYNVPRVQEIHDPMPACFISNSSTNSFGQKNQCGSNLPSDTAYTAEPKGNEGESIIGGTQKTAEKMRRDEDLGSMATISAVLYANIKHPDLKEEYPNWNDRCKQILKRWRSLSTEKKAPFLQHAKDNRSALRMRRAQQEQQKINYLQKSSKEEEHEKAWKLHQSKLKESQTNMFVNYSALSFNADDNYSQNTTNQKQLIGRIGDMTNTEITQLANIPDLEGSSFVSEEISDKKLRHLLQKSASEPVIVKKKETCSFMHDSDFKMALLTNTGMHHNNPMLGSNEKPEPTELKQSFQKLEQALKIQVEPKLCEQSESVSTAELEKLESDENGAFGDILGGLGEGDDDDLLKSLTSEIGDDFNILEYADPELDVLASSQLGALDFEDNEKSTQI